MRKEWSVSHFGHSSLERCPHNHSGLSWLCHDKPEIHSGSTPSLQPRFGTFGLLVVPKLEGDVKGSTFFIRCRSWGGCAHMDQQQTRNLLHQRNGEMDRTSEEMYGHKWWLRWKISVKCGRELNFLHSDITVIILHGQILILYNWRPYLSITPRNYSKTNIFHNAIWKQQKKSSYHLYTPRYEQKFY